MDPKLTPRAHEALLELNESIINTAKRGDEEKWPPQAQTGAWAGLLVLAVSSAGEAICSELAAIREAIEWGTRQ